MSEPAKQQQDDRTKQHAASAEPSTLRPESASAPPEPLAAAERAAPREDGHDPSASGPSEAPAAPLAGQPDALEPVAEPQAETEPAAAETSTAAEMPAAAVESEADRDRQRQAADAQVLAVSRRHTRRSFVAAAAAVAASFGVYRYLNVGPTDEMQPVPLEDAYKFNAAVSRGVFRNQPLAPTYPLSRAETLRINGIYGLKRDIVPESWRLQLVGTQDAPHHPRFVPDVTAWEYRYMAPPANEDKGHDTKVDPSKEAGAQPTPGVPPPASGQAPPDARPDNEKNGGQGAPRGDARPISGKPDPKIMSSIKMAPASMLQQSMLQQSMKQETDDDNDGEDDNHSGRKPRGMEEAGESDSTLPPHTPGLLLQLADITRLPRVELVTQFKCIEGWSQIVHWAGVRMADFLELYPPEPIDGKEPRYVYMETPDGDYYTGYDLHTMRHPQTLLVTEMMGAALTQNHGAPLRLHMPTKYGYKQIKRIGLIAYTNTKPDDYWTKLGYDWYAGL